MLISTPRQPLGMSQAEMVQSGLIQKVRSRDLICKKCCDQGLEGLVFEDENGDLICPIHGPVKMAINRIINEATPQFRGRYEADLARRKKVDQQLSTITQPREVLELDENQMRDLAIQMWSSSAGVRKLIVRDQSGQKIKKATQLLQKQASIELVYMLLENDCDARKKECYVFPVYADEDKSKPENQRSAVDFSVCTGYPFHHRKAEDLGYQTVGRLDYTWGEARILTNEEMLARGVRVNETTCPKCDGNVDEKTGKTYTEWYDKAEKKMQRKECYKCKGTGKLPPERVMGVEASLYVLSQAKEAKDSGVPYVPIKAVGYVSLDNDTAWRGSDLFEKAKKRAEVACLKKYAPVRSHSGLMIGYVELPEDLESEAEEYVEAAYREVKPSQEILEEEPQGEPVSEQ